MISENARGVLCVIFLVLISVSVLSEDADAVDIVGIQPNSLRDASNSVLGVDIQAQPIERVAPDYPEEAVRRQLEGWVVVRYTVTELGTVEDVLVDMATAPLFIQPTINALKQWKYQPAQTGGLPVRTEGLSTILTYGFEWLDDFYNDNQIRPMNAPKFGAFDKAMRKDRFNEAEYALQEIASTAKLTNYEVSVLDYGRYRLAAARGEQYKAWLAISRAVFQKNLWANKKAFATLLRFQLRLAFDLKRYRDVARIAGELKDIGGTESLTKVAGLIEQAERIVRSGSLIQVSGLIDPSCNCGNAQSFWSLPLSRRSLEFRNVSATTDRYELYCVGGVQRKDVAEGERIDIPASWGQCDILVFGDSGARFDLNQY